MASAVTVQSRGEDRNQDASSQEAQPGEGAAMGGTPSVKHGDTREGSNRKRDVGRACTRL